MKICITVKMFLIVALLLPFAMGCNAQTEKTEPTVTTEKAPPAATSDKKAADFSLMDLNGETVKLSDYAGKVVIIDFWATWCPPCVKEIPHFNELAEEYADKGLVVLGISVDRDGKDVVKEFMKNRIPIGYRVAMSNPDIYATYQGYLPSAEQGGIPFTFIIDRQGNIVNHYVGYRPKEVFVDAITPLLGGS